MVRYLCLFLFSVSAMGADLVLEQLPVLTIDQNGNASATLTLRNNGTAAIPLHLKLSDFTHKRLDGKEYHVGTPPVLTPVNEKDRPILDGAAPLAVNGTLAIKVAVTNLWEGQSQATLKNGDADVPALGGPTSAVLQAVRIPAVYNVQIVSATPDAPEIHIVGDKALIGLKNSDPFNYRFQWKLRLNERIYDGGPVDLIELVPGDTTWKTIPASETNDFPLAGWWTAGTLKDETSKGSLILERVFEGNPVLQPLASKDLPVTFRLSRWRGHTQVFSNGLWIFFLLAVGGLFSIWLRYSIPNYNSGLALRRRILERRTKIEGMDADLDARWRVLLWFHLEAIRQELNSTPWFYPSFSAKLTTLTTRMEMVHQWVEVAYGVATTLHRAGEVVQEIPPTVLQWIQEGCSRALTPLESGFTASEEIAAMNANLKTSQKCLDLTLAHSANPELEQEISSREKRFTPVLLQRLTADYPQFGGVIGTVTAGAGTAPSPSNYMLRDIASLKVDLLRTFDERVQQLRSVVSGSVADALKRLQDHKPALLAYLVPDTHESLSMARIFVDEVRQDLYPDGLMKDDLLKLPPLVTVTTIPAAVQSRKPVKMELRFDREILNEAAGRREWTCTWDFGDREPNATGWEVFHSYDKPDSYTVTIAIRDRDGNPVLPSPFSDTVSVGGPSAEETKLIEQETQVEGGRLAILLAIAFLALMTTARQQIQNLTFFEAVAAVVALGFGANVLKDLVTQRQPGR